MDSVTCSITTPLGSAVCVIDADGAVSELMLTEQTGDALNATEHPVALQVQLELDEYFAGQRQEFTVPLAPQGTGFQQRVWAELQRIPHGTTITYTELAQRLGDLKAIRAVGGANGANPVWIIIPCHRVIGADGSLTGYAGGIEVKHRLLELEGVLQPGLF